MVHVDNDILVWFPSVYKVWLCDICCPISTSQVFPALDRDKFATGKYDDMLPIHYQPVLHPGFQSLMLAPATLIQMTPQVSCEKLYSQSSPNFLNFLSFSSSCLKHTQTHTHTHTHTCMHVPMHAHTHTHTNRHDKMVTIENYIVFVWITTWSYDIFQVLGPDKHGSGVAGFFKKEFGVKLFHSTTR